MLKKICRHAQNKASKSIGRERAKRQEDGKRIEPRRDSITQTTS